MLTSTVELLQAAREGGYAVGAFNIYNLEGVLATVRAAETEHSPVMLQIHPSALRHGGQPLIAMCLAAAKEAAGPMSVHLDHSTSADDMHMALAAGLTSIMADGSHLAYAENIAFTREMTAFIHACGGVVEAELGRLSGTEDGLTIPEYEARLTKPDQAADFVTQTRVDMLAVCIGNLHGPYRDEPRLDFDRLAAIRAVVSVPLVLHGASGLPENMISRAIKLGICKVNVNTEVRQAYMEGLKEQLISAESSDLLELMQSAITAMQAVIATKLRLFGSTGKG
jgi:tagatose 1,6-diphosphate aldolase GatY/KbaY